MKNPLLPVVAMCCLAAAAVALPLPMQARSRSPFRVPIRVRAGDRVVEPFSYGALAPMGGNFTPIPPPIQCDDFKANNGIACVYVVSVAKMLVTPLVIGNVSMPDKNPHFVVSPPKNITEGGWFSFHTLLDWSNQTAPIDPWSGVVQYSSKDATGITYIFQIVFNFGGGAVDISFDFPQHHGLDVGPEVRSIIAFARERCVRLHAVTCDHCRCSTTPSSSLASKSSTRRSRRPLLKRSVCGGGA